MKGICEIGHIDIPRTWGKKLETDFFSSNEL